MPGYRVERTFRVTIEKMPPVASRSKRIGNTEFPAITWEHSHVVVGGDSHVRTFCVYTAPEEEMVGGGTKDLETRFIDVSDKRVGDMTTEDLPETYTRRRRSGIARPG